jgi:hypothetical protein
MASDHAGSNVIRHDDSQTEEMSMWTALAFVIGFLVFPATLYLLRNVLPPTLFTPDDW